MIHSVSLMKMNIEHAFLGAGRIQSKIKFTNCVLQKVEFRYEKCAVKNNQIF